MCGFRVCGIGGCVLSDVGSLVNKSKKIKVFIYGPPTDIVRKVLTHQTERISGSFNFFLTFFFQILNWIMRKKRKTTLKLHT